MGRAQRDVTGALQVAGGAPSGRNGWGIETYFCDTFPPARE